MSEEVSESTRLMLAQSQLNNELKQPMTAWILWWFLGSFGAHRLYLTGSKVMLILGCTIIGLIITIPWAIVDIFLIPGMIKTANMEITSEVYVRNGLTPGSLGV